jgi:hypothetical protein
MSNKFYTGISSEYVEHWGFWEGCREAIQNATDQEDHSVEVQDAQGQIWLSVQSYGATIPKEMFLMGKSGKRDDDTKTGKYGEGFLLSLLALLREGKEVRIKNGFDKLIPTLEPHPQLREDCLAIEIVEDFYGIEDTDGSSVDITVHGLTQEDVNILDGNYLPFHMNKYNNWWWEENIRVDYEGCQIFRYDTDIKASDREALDDSGCPKKVFVNGLFVCDLPDKYVFSYNLTPDRINLDRDRKSVDTWDLQREVADILEQAQAFELMVQMSEEKVPDLYEYYIPSTYRSVGGGYYSGGEREESVSQKVAKLAGDNFIKRNGANAIAVRSDIAFAKKEVMFKRIKLAGKVPVEVPVTNYKMLPTELKEVDTDTPVTNVTPLKAVQQYYDNNKKHIRSKARKEFKKLIEDLVLIS